MGDELSDEDAAKIAGIMAERIEQRIDRLVAEIAALGEKLSPLVELAEAMRDNPMAAALLGGGD